MVLHTGWHYSLASAEHAYSCKNTERTSAASYFFDLLAVCLNSLSEVWNELSCQAHPSLRCTW